MANALYDTGRAAFLSGLDWTSATFKAALVADGYTPNLSTDQFLDDIPADQIVATSPALTGATSTDGVADADNVTFSAVSGSEATFLVIYEDTGASATSQLVACIDTATGLPLTPNGGDVTVAWDSGSNKIFRL